MKLKVKHTLNTQFSLSSMTDIVFLLLLFFMLTISFVPPVGLTVDVPTSHHANPVAPQVKVTITANLIYYVDNEEIDRHHLKEVLAQKLSDPARLIFLQVDKTVPIQQMIEVVDVANSLQAQVAVATRPD